MLAYHNDQAVKDKYLARVRAHREADQLRAGIGFENGIGCAVGCTFDSYDHARGPVEIGVPVVLMYLEDAIFEGLARTGGDHLAFPEAFLAAIPVGADLSMVWPRFALALLSDPESPVTKAANDQTRPAIDGVAALYRRWVDTGNMPSLTDFDAAAAAAASAAAWAASAAAWAAAAAAAAASAAAWAAAAAAAAASAAAWAAWCWMRDLLLRLLSETPHA